MDSSQGALNRVLRWAAFRHDVVLEQESPGGCRHSTTSRAIDDQLQALNEHGDTELLFLLSFHQTSVDTLETFFRDIPLTSALLAQTNKDGVNALHMAVFRNSFHASAIVSWLLDHGGVSLAAAKLLNMDLPLHILVTHAVTLDCVVLDRVLNAYPAGAGMSDANGTTPLHMLYQNVQRFRWATTALVTDFQAAPIIEEETDSLTTPKKLEKTLSLLDDANDDWAYMTIITPRQFVKCSLQLIGAIHHQEHQPSIHEVVATPQCPALLVHLVLQSSSTLLDREGRTPLHMCSPDNTELLAYLLYSRPLRSTALSYNGQWPLHTCPAVILARAAPQVLWVQDPVTRLWPWSLAGAALGTSSLSDVAVANNIYLLLRMEPGVLAFQRRQPQQ